MVWQLEIRLDRNDRPGFYRHLQPNADSTGIRYCGKVALVKCKVGFRDSINLSFFQFYNIATAIFESSHGDKLVTCAEIHAAAGLSSQITQLKYELELLVRVSTVTVRNNLICPTLPCSWRNDFLWDTCSSDGRLVKEFSRVSSYQPRWKQRTSLL